MKYVLKVIETSGRVVFRKMAPTLNEVDHG